MNLLESFDLVILNETVVERLFTMFGDDFKLNNSCQNWIDLEKYMQGVLKKYKIKIIIKQIPGQKEVGGEYRVWSDEIIMTVPKNFNSRNLQKFMSVFFHEFAHYLKEEKNSKAAGRFNPTETDSKNYSRPVDPRLLTNQYGFYGLFLEKNNRDDLMNQMIRYWTQQHERSGIAFSIAYDIYDDTKPFKEDMVRFYIDNFVENWTNYHKTGDYSAFDWSAKRFSPGFMILLALIFYRQELSSRRQLTRENIQNIPKLLELTKKYYRRIGGILNSSKT